jgi:transcriptional regulator with XRE-family HTH domain
VQPVSADHVALGLAIREHRAARGWSQDALADAIGVTRNWVGMIERGEGNVALTHLMRVARALEVPLADLVAPVDAPRDEG